MNMSHIVVVPLVITKRPDGSNLYLYEGAELPDFVGSDEAARLVEGKFVEKVDGRSAKPGKPSAESN